MRKRKILSYSETQVSQILDRTIAQGPYRVFASVRLSDVLSKEPGDRLTETEFNFYTRSHLDFVVTSSHYPHEPIFAIEFDGPSHFDEKQIRRDVIKNRLCSLANLPLLRIGPAMIEERDQITFLDYLMSRFLAWQVEHEHIEHEICEFAASLPPQRLRELVEESEPYLDPDFVFHIRHPFPGITEVQKRLYSDFSIVTGAWPPSENCRSDLKCDVWVSSSGPASNNEQLLETSASVAIFKKGPPEQRIFEANRPMYVRSWLPLQVRVPNPSIFATMTEPQLRFALQQFQQRASAIWIPEIPGVSAFNIGEQLSQYLAYRAAEDWSRSNLR